MHHPGGYSVAFATLLVLQLLAFTWLLIGAREPHTHGKVPGTVS